MSKQKNQAPAKTKCEEKPSMKPESFAELFNRARRRANRGDERARDSLKKYLDGHPDVIERFGNLARVAEETLIDAASGNDWFMQESVRRHAANLRENLSGPSPSVLETLGIERVVACWLALQHVRILGRTKPATTSLR